MLIADAMGATVATLVAVIVELQTQIGLLEAELADRLNNTRTPRSSVPCQDWG